MKRFSSLAYGRPELGALVIGGENNDSFTLVDFTVDRSYHQIIVNAIIRVRGTGATDTARASSLATNISALVDLLHNSGNFSFNAGGSSLTTNGGISISGGKIAVTSPDGGFTSSMVSQAVDVEGVGSFQIEEYVSANTVKCTPSSILANPSPVASGLTIRVGSAVIRTVESSRTAGYFGRAGIARQKDPLDSRFRRTFALSVTFEVPATSSLDSGRRQASISVTTDPSNMRTVRFAGQYTGSGTSTALSVFDSQFDSWAGPVITSLGGTFEKLSPEIRYDDESALLAFNVIYREVVFPENAGGSLDVAAIKSAQVAMSRRQATTHGKKGEKARTYVEVIYSAAIDKTTVPHGSILGYYESTIKPLLLAQIEAKFGAAAIILQDLPTPHFASSAISVFLLVEIEQSEPTIAFQKTVSFGLSGQKDFRQRWKSKLHKYTIFTPGPMITATISVQEAAVGAPTYSGMGLVESEPVGSVGDAVAEEDYDNIQAPGKPPFPSSLLGDDNEWILVDVQVDHTPRFRGLDIEELGVQDVVILSSYQTTWVWGQQELDAPVEVGGPEEPEDALQFVHFGGGLGPISPTEPPVFILEPTPVTDPGAGRLQKVERSPRPAFGGEGPGY